MCMVVMAREDLNLTSEIMASCLMKDGVRLLGEKFGFPVGVRLEVLEKDECITGRTETRVAFHKAFLNVNLRISMLPVMVDLLW